MSAALLAGIAAGLGIAIPVGAIAILIVETGLRRGFRLALAAGAGAASADGLYAVIAALFGSALAGVLAPWERPLRIAAVLVLVGVAARGLRDVRAAIRERGAAKEPLAVRWDGHATSGQDAARTAVRSTLPAGRALRTYGAFLGLTLLNPMTVVYFAALILGLGTTGSGPTEKLAFALGAFGASLAWQSTLAAAGAILHRRLSPGLRLGVSLLGNVIILIFAAVIGRALFG